MTTPLPGDYLHRVYSGVLGKVLGVYLGRPVESWTYERIREELGDVPYYVHDRVGVPLVVVDDDITGTFAFLRAFVDSGRGLDDIQPGDIAEAWLNSVIEERNIFWWGGFGNSTEHTAYLRLKSGVEAPRSGSIALNGPLVAEQIGAQIFIDGWAMLLPGQPEAAATLARKAASVSHDGEAVYAAQALAAMEAQAFVEADIDRLLDTGLSVIPRDCVIARMIADLRRWHREEPDWRVARERLAAEYGYDAYGGNVHVVPNHGVIVLALLYGGGSWDESMMIVNTCGWDTDCNSGNLGCLLGIRNGLATFEGRQDWRGPVADRLFLPTADGNGSVTDAASLAIDVANLGRHLAGEPEERPKDGARYHFTLPGSVQGFQVVDGRGRIGNAGEGGSGGALTIRLHDDAPLRVMTDTFTPPGVLSGPGYGMVASPALHTGQVVRATVSASADNPSPVSIGLSFRQYRADDTLVPVDADPRSLRPGESAQLSWRIPETGGLPVQAVGLTVAGSAHAVLSLSELDWSGEPEVVLARPAGHGLAWRKAWVDAMDLFTEGWGPGWPESYRLIQNSGRGYLFQGTRAWHDYTVEADMTPHLAKAFGIVARAQGLRRHYSFVITDDGKAVLLKQTGGAQVLAETAVEFVLYRTYTMALSVRGDSIRASLDGRRLFDIADTAEPLTGGGVGLVCEQGRVGVETVRITPS